MSFQNYVPLVILSFLLISCGKNDDATEVAEASPNPLGDVKSASPNAVEVRPSIANDKHNSTHKFDFNGFELCRKSSREDIVKNFELLNAKGVETAIDQKLKITTVSGELRSDVGKFKLSADLWGGRLMSLTAEEFSGRFEAQVNKNFGPIVDVVNETTRAGSRFKRETFKSPDDSVLISRITIQSRYEIPPFYEFECSPVRVEFNKSIGLE